MTATAASVYSGPPPVSIGYAALDAAPAVKAAAAGRDFIAGLQHYRSARYLAVEAMKNQYRRTVLGPWWVTLQAAAFTMGLAVIFGQLQGSSTKDFLPFVSVGYLYFVLLSGIVRVAATVFTASGNVISSTRQPLTGLVLRDVTVEFLQFGHNAVILGALFAARLIDISWTLLLVPVVLVVTAVNAVAMAYWLGPLVARYRDVGPAVISVLQVAMFITPVFYTSRGFTGSAAVLVEINPFTVFLQVLRPLVLGDTPDAVRVLALAGITVANVVVGAVTFSATRSRIPYWVA